MTMAMFTLPIIVVDDRKQRNAKETAAPGPIVKEDS